MSKIIATTKRLILREIEADDQDLVFKLSLESSALSHLATDDVFLELYREVSWKEINLPSTFNALMFLKETGDFVGKICMQFIDQPLPQLGIDLLNVHQNNGYGPEAIIAFCNWYAAEHKLSEIMVRINKDNSHSIHVFEKLGAQYVGSTPYLSADHIEVVKERLPGVDLSDLLNDDINNYTLPLPLPHNHT